MRTILLKPADMLTDTVLDRGLLKGYSLPFSEIVYVFMLDYLKDDKQYAFKYY